MADYTSTQRLRSLFEDDEEKKKKEGVTVSTPQSDSVDFSRADNAASNLEKAFADFDKVAPSRQQKPQEQAPIVEAEKPRQKGEYRGNFFQKLGQSYVDVIKSVPSQTLKGVGMVFGAPENAANFATDQLMKIDSYNQFMQDAARGIDLGKGRAAVAILNTGALGIGDLKPVLNTKVGQEIATNISDKTSNLPLKTVAAFRAIGEGTYKEYRDAMLADRYDPENGNVEKFLYELQDSGVQSLVGILLTTGTVLATRNPKAGYAIGGAYYGALSAGEQIQSEGKVTSSGNIYIDVIGDSLINNALLGVFKMPAAAVNRVLATGALEGSTEVVQSLLKFANSYSQADTEQERQEILEDAAYYVKSGAILMEFGVGAVVGSVAQGGVEVLNTAATSKTRTDVKNSLAFDIEAAIEAGDVDPATIYQNGKDGVLTPQFAEGRVNDVAQKLGKLDPSLEAQYRSEVDINNETMESVIAKGEALIDSFTAPTAQGTEEVLNTAGSTKAPEEQKLGDVFKDIEQVADLIARSQRGEELSVAEQSALIQAQQSFADYASAFEATTVSLPNEVAPSEPPIAEIQVVDVGDKVAVKYSADAGETALQIDYDLNALYNSPEDATEAAINSIAAFIESQRSNPNISPVAQRRLEDIMQKLRPAKQTIKPPKKEKDTAAPVETAPTAGAIAIGTEVYFAGRPRKVTAIIPFGGETKYQLTDDKGRDIYTNEAGVKTAIEAKELGITEEEVLKRRNEANGTPKKKKETERFTIKPDKELGFVVLEKKGEKNVVAGTFSTEEKAKEFIAGQQKTEKKTQKEKVKEVIDQKGEASIKDIADITGILEPNIRRILGVGAKQGEFERVDTGVYRIKVGDKEIAFVMAADAVETLPKLAAQGFKADMIFLDIPYETKAVKGGNRGVNYDFLSVENFRKVVFSIKEIVRDENTPVIHMYSQAESGMAEMTRYNEVFTELDFKPVAKGEWQKTYKDGSPVAFPTRNGSMVTKPEGILVFTLSGETDKQLESLQFKTVRPKGYQTEKAEEMLKAMIEMTTDEGDVVFDPFAGSGVTGAAAVKAGRRTVVIEKNAEVAETVTKPRIQKAVNERIKATNVTAEDTAEMVMANGAPEKAERIVANANTLTIVPDNLDVEVELFNGKATRPEQLVSKTKLNGIFGKEDRIVFTVLIEEARIYDQKKKTVENREVVYLYNKTATGETKLRASALGLVEQNLTVGQEVVLDKSELKANGRNFKAVDREGNVFAEPKAVNYQNNVLRKQDILDTFDPAKTAGYYDAATRQRLFERFILPKLKKIGTVEDGETVVYYQPADGESGQYVNRDLARVWWIADINADFVVKKVKENELISTGFAQKDEVGEAIYFPAKKDRIGVTDGRLRNLNNGRFVSRSQAKKLASSEFAAVSERVKRAEPAGKRPSSFASREPAKDSKMGDVAMNREELSKGSQVEYDKLVKRSEIARVLTTKLNAVVRTGKFRQAALGIYKQDTDTIRMSNKNFSTREGGQLTTLVHELGHYIDYSIQKYRNVIPKAELKPLLENYGAGFDSVAKNKVRSEAFAEFLRYYITIPAEAKSRAPEFYKYFVDSLESLPEIKEALNTAQVEFRRWAEQPATAKVAAQISFEQEDKEGFKTKLNTTVNSIYRDAVNDLHAISQFSEIAKKSKKDLEADKDPYILARNMRGWIGRAQYFLESGTTGRDFWKKGDNGRFYVDKKGKSLKEILQPVEDKNALNDLSVYLVSRRALELSERNITSGVTPEDAEIALREIEAKHPEFAQVARDLDTYQNHLLDYLEESGVLNPDDRKKMQEANKMYVPFFRVHEELTNKGYMGGKKIPTKSPIKRIKGSEKDIIDPLESIVKNTYVLLNAAERNNVMRAMANLAENDKNLGRLFERVPVDQTKVASVNPKEIVYQALGADTVLGKAMLPAEVQAAIDIVVPETMVNIFRPAMFQKGNVVAVMDNGKPKYYELDKDLYEAINATEVEEVIAAVKILSYPAQFLRAGATLAPEFMVRNPLRDSIGAAVMSKNGFVPFYDTIRGFASLVKKDEYYDAFVIAGGLQSTIVAQDRNNLKQSKDELLKRSARIKKLIKNPLEVLQIISSYTEQATRIGEARLALNAGKSATQAAFDAREVTLDFQRAGAKARSLNKLSAFFNAKIQGNDKLIRTFIETPAKATLKATLYITLPSVILWLLNQDEEGWDEIPQWQKDIFWLVKVDDTWYRIPKPFELGVLFGSIPERFLEYLKDNDPAGLQEVTRSFITGLVPNPIPTGVVPILENTTNYSFFLDRPIVSPSLENLPNQDQYTNTTSETAKLIGAAINYSPAKVDNLLYGYFAGLGRHTVNTADAILKGTGIVNSVPEPEKTKADIPVLKAFVVRDPAGSSSNSVNDFYENRTEATKYYNKYKDLLEAGDRDGAREYLAEHPEIKLYKPYNQIASQISDLRKLSNQVYDSETMSPEEKRKKIDELNQLITDTAYRANNIELQ
jgi:hypothetical protein